MGKGPGAHVGKFHTFRKKGHGGEVKSKGSRGDGPGNNWGEWAGTLKGGGEKPIPY